MFKKSFITLIGFSFVFLTGCHLFKSSPKIDDTKKQVNRQDTLFVADLSDQPIYDWSQVREWDEALVISNLMEGLTRIQSNPRNVSFEPALAENWEVSSNGLEYRFTIKDNVKWSDGKKLTAQHFVDAFERVFSPGSKEPVFDILVIKGAKKFFEGKNKNFETVGVKAKGDLTLVFRLESPHQTFPSLLAHPSTFPIRKDIEDRGLKRPVLGPFIVEKFDSSKYTMLKSNPLYHGETPALKNVVVYSNLDFEGAYSAFRTGKIDVVLNIPPTETSGLRGLRSLQPFQDWSLFFVAFNVRQKPFNNPIFRRAIAMAINRGELAETLGGALEVTSSVIPPRFFAHESNRGVRFDPRAAKKLLNKSGYRNLKRYKTFQLKHGDRKVDKLLAENLQKQLKDHLDLDMELVSEGLYEKVPWKAGPTFYFLRKQPLVPDSFVFMEFFNIAQKFRFTGWRHYDFRKYLQRIAGESKDRKRLRLFAKTQHLFVEKENALVPVLLGRSQALVGQRIFQFPLNVDGALLFKEVEVQ